MARLVWDEVGARVYQFGVDRGVLYPVTGDGVAWNGLTAVTEKSDGGDIQSYYVDGIKYLMQSESEDFTATLEAFTYPDEFLVCEGTTSVSSGLFITKQRRQSFGLTYRSKTGNDTSQNLGYSIHIVYGARVSPADRNHQTVGETVDPLNFSWDIETVPPVIDGFKPASHFIVDSRTTPAIVLAQIEDILYGTDTDAPRIPVIEELVFIFEIYETSVYDAGYSDTVYYLTLDGGSTATTPQPSTVDGGSA